VSTLLCHRCESPALVIYENEPLCGPCALIALDENHHYLVVQVDDTDARRTAPVDSETKQSHPV
jgi:hypothetical protein